MDKIINDLFKYIKRDNVLTDFTDINPKSGIIHRGSVRLTNKNAAGGYTTKDLTSIKSGLLKLAAHIKEQANQIKITK